MLSENVCSKMFIETILLCRMFSEIKDKANKNNYMLSSANLCFLNLLRIIHCSI